MRDSFTQFVRFDQSQKNDRTQRPVVHQLFSKGLLLAASFLLLANLSFSQCDNVINGGIIEADEFGCPNPDWDPSIITSVEMPIGGTGTLEFIWISTTDDPTLPSSFWDPIIGSTSAEYDPGPITETTWFRRCVRRSGCTDYIGESNIVVKEAICCDNVTDGGEIGQDQVFCQPPYDPAALTNVVFPSGGSLAMEYQWVSSTTGTPYTPMNADWTEIDGATMSLFNPEEITETTYYIRLSRRHGCLDYDGVSNMVTVTVTGDIVPGMFGMDETCLEANDGSVAVINVSGGAAPYTYQWTGLPGETDSILINQGAGVFEVVVTDANGCTGSLSYTLNDGPALNVQTAATAETCVGANDGTATVADVPDGSAPFSYSWNDGLSQTTQTATALAPSTYEVVVTDDRGCIGTGTAQIDAAVPLDLSTSGVDATCGDSSDGTATAQVTGGVAPYTYLWDDPAAQTTATAANLPQGTYSVTVTDANNCSATASQSVGAPDLAVLNISTTDVLCFGANDGTATVAVVGQDISGFSVIWDNVPPSANPTATGLAPGVYNVTVTDPIGCSVTGSTSISEPTALDLSLSSTPASCFDSSDGTAIVNVTGGTEFGNGGYLYEWDAPGNPAVQMLDDVGAGTYTVTVTDANGCTAQGSITIDAPSQMQITEQVTNVSCFGFSDGAVSVSVAGGTSPYTYQWNDPSNSTSPAISNLVAGAYGLTVTDANNCIETLVVNVTQPAGLTLGFNNINVVCVDDTDGVAVAVVEGGTQPYEILWETGQATQAIFGLGVGSYGVTITDAHGCQVSSAAQIISTTTISSTTNAFDATCFDVANGVAIASGVDGTPPYSYEWSNGETTPQINDLFFGTYDVTVTDSDGCSVTNSATVNSPPLLVATANILSEVETFGGTEGSAEVAVTGGVPPYSILWSNGANVANVSGLSGGTHSVTVTDANSCTATAQITLIEPSKIGDYIWNDENQNGIQDLMEVGVGGITVHLTGTDGNGDAVDLSTVSEADGFYAFDGLLSGFYRLTFDTPPNHVVTYQNVGNDLLDSDPDPTTGQTQGFPISQGEYESRWDCGMIILDEKIDLGDKVWYDQNHDGLQDPNEAGVPGVIVRLRSWPANTILAQQVTDLLGNYLFEDIFAGNYVIEFMPASFPPGGYEISPKDVGNDDNIDSDADLVSGFTDPITVLPFTLDNLTIDMGIFRECDNVTDGGVTGYDEQLCGVGADPAEIVNIVLPSGGYGNIEYLWLKSSVPIYNGPTDPNWSIIPNSNSPTYDPGPIGVSTYYIRCSRREGCSDYIGESNVVAKEIIAFPLSQIIDEPNLLCMNEQGRFEAAIAGAGADYFWQFSGGSPSTATTRVALSQWPNEGFYPVSLTVTRFGCSFSVSTTVEIENCGSRPSLLISDVNAELQGEEVMVKFEVNGDTKNTIFFLEKSEDGSDFSTFAILRGVEGVENSTYQHMDKQPRFGENIYRIKYQQMDDSEEEGYSQTASVMFQPERTMLAHTFPNPTTGRVTVELLKANEEVAFGSVVSPFGKVLQTFEIPANTEKFEIDLNGYYEGLYVIKLQRRRMKTQLMKVFKSN
ncbi:MAG TPA: hypothetical protein ENJ95_03180 [Bacteroidetes bacterium]|nr:hypothetical protein [Bacteroidota bacterium]